MAQDKKLNLTPQEHLPEFRVSQGDVGRELIAHIKNGPDAYEIPAGATVTFVGIKPSGLGFTITGTADAEDDGKVTFVTEATMDNEVGRILSEIRITDGNGLRIGTTNVMLIVERDPHPDDTTDGDAPALINEITALLEEITEQAEIAEAAADRAEQAAATAGYLFFYINDEGHLMMQRTSNTQVDFYLEAGHLYVEAIA